MNDLILIQEIERYLEGTMSIPEREAFEALRQRDPAVDQQVVEHKLLIEQLRASGQRQQLLARMNAIHAKAEIPVIPVTEQRITTPVIGLRNRRTWLNLAAAACIALVTSLSTIAIMQKQSKKQSTAQYEDVRRVLNNIQRSQNAIVNTINSGKKAPVNPGTYGGTCFAISRNGYMVTNYHVIAGADSIYIQNTKGEAFKAISVFEDVSSDLAVLRIADSTFRMPALPYGLKLQPVRPGEEVFSMGFPRDEIVYGKGYISAQTGFNGDTLAYQVSIPVNPGNSGAPLLDSNGEVIGIITGKQSTSDGIAFAVKSGHLKRLLDELPKDKFSRKDLKHHNTLSGSRVEQLKKLEDFVYMVKVYN